MMTGRSSTLLQLGAALCLALLFTVLTRLLFQGEAQASNLYGGVSSFMTYVGAILFGYVFRTGPAVSGIYAAPRSNAPIGTISHQGVTFRIVACVTATLFFGNGLASGFMQHIHQLIDSGHMHADEVGSIAIQIDVVALISTLMPLACLVYMFHIGFMARGGPIKPIVIGVLISDGLYAVLYFVFSLGRTLQIERLAGKNSLSLLPNADTAVDHLTAISTFLGLTLLSLIMEIFLVWVSASLGGLVRRQHDGRMVRQP